MKGFIILTCSLLIVTDPMNAGGNHGQKPTTQSEITTRILDVNRLTIQVTDRGNLLKDLSGERGGISWDYGGPFREIVVFDHGPWIIGKVNGSPAMGAAFYKTSYAPGPMIDGLPALFVRPQDSVRYHPYKISSMSGMSDPDYLQWPGDLGAPTNSSGKPLLFADGVVWAVFNGADSTAYPSSTIHRPFAHLPVEIQQSVYAHASSASDTSLLASTAFLEWTFINKGAAIVESCYIGVWTDVDIIHESKNPFAVDTLLQTGFVWDSWPADTVYSPRAVGYTLLYGPVVSAPATNAVFQGHILEGHRNLPLSSFWGMQNDVGLPPNGPYSISDAWNLARGYDKAGNVIIDSVTMLPTRFPWSGDPVTGSGWVYKGGTEGGAGFMMFSGPFTFAPRDTQWVMLALTAAGGVDKIQGIQTVRSRASRLRTMSYENIAGGQVVSVTNSMQTIPVTPILCPNYPNPFNPTTTLAYQLPATGIVKLAVFDLLGQQIAELASGVHTAGSYSVRWDASSVASGVFFARFVVTDGIGNVQYSKVNTLVLMK